MIRIAESRKKISMLLRIAGACFALSCEAIFAGESIVDKECRAWTEQTRKNQGCDAACPQSQALGIDKYDYVKGLNAAFAQRTGLSSFIAYTGRSTIMGAAADVQACNIYSLLMHWGDLQFSQTLARFRQTTRDSVMGLLDYAEIENFEKRFPHTYALAKHVDV